MFACRYVVARVLLGIMWIDIMWAGPSRYELEGPVPFLAVLANRLLCPEDRDAVGWRCAESAALLARPGD